MISFLIPVYNTAEYIDQLMESILCQKMDEFEIIMLNDGSTDNSLEKCFSYQRKYPEKVKVISRDNKGAVRTRRELFEASRGEWIWIIDSDDFIADNAVESIVNVCNSTDADLIMFDYYRIVKSNVIINYQLDVSDGTVFEAEGKNELYRNFISGVRLNALWNKVFKRNCIDFNNDYSYYEDVKRSNDKLQTIAILTNAKKIVYLKKPLYYYQYREGSLVNVFKEYTYPSIRKVTQRLEEYVNIWNLTGEMQDALLEMKANDVCSMLVGYRLSTSIKPSFTMYAQFFKRITQDPLYKTAILEVSNSKVKDKILFSLVRNEKVRASFNYIYLRRIISIIVHKMIK